MILYFLQHFCCKIFYKCEEYAANVARDPFFKVLTRSREVNLFTRTKYLLSKLNFRKVRLFRIECEIIQMMFVLKSVLSQRHTEGENVTSFVIVILRIACRNI